MSAKKELGHITQKPDQVWHQFDPDRLVKEIVSSITQLPSRTTPALRTLRRKYSRLLTLAPPDLVIEIALRLLKKSPNSCRFVASEIVARHRGAFQALTCQQILELGAGLDSWGAVDCFGCYVSGPAWRSGQISTELIRNWAESKDRLWRRAALVSTISLSRRGKPEDLRRTIEICSLLVSDCDDMVIKALSWALRELAKKDPKKAHRFLQTHTHLLAARVRREVQNKIATGLKNPPPSICSTRIGL